MSNVLVLEKTVNIHALLKKRFSADHNSVDATQFVAGATEKLNSRWYNVLIWDAAASKTEQSKGLELLDLLTKDSSRTYIIVVTAREGGSLPIDRLKTYAHRTLMRPLDEDEICAVVSEALHQQISRAESGLHQEIPVPLEFEGMLGASLPMREVFQRIIEAASEDIAVLISDETGTGM